MPSMSELAAELPIEGVLRGSFPWCVAWAAELKHLFAIYPAAPLGSHWRAPLCGAGSGCSPARYSPLGASPGAEVPLDATGDCQPRKFGGHKRYALAEHEDKVRALVAGKPDLTVTELWQKITPHGIKAGRSAVARFLLHLQLTFKKTLHATEQERPDVKAVRVAWRAAEKP